MRYVEDAFVDSYYPTIENIFNKCVKYKGVEYDCDVIDTAGQVCARVWTGRACRSPAPL